MKELLENADEFLIAGVDAVPGVMRV